MIAIADYADIKDYTLYEGEEDDEDAQIPEDNIQPIVIGDDENEVAAEEKKVAINEEKVADSLLSKIKTDLPSKVEEATEAVEEKE